MITLRRVTSSGKFLPQIDGLRCIAIISVVFFHLQVSLSHNGAVAFPFTSIEPNLNFLSKRGVELFFVISGFVLGLPFARGYVDGTAPVRLKDYFLRRLSRLEPPYILNLIFCTTILVLSQKYSPKTVLEHFLASVGYLDHSIFAMANIINVVTWSLEIEVQFYCLMPLLALVFAIRSPRLSSIVLLCSIVATSILSLPLLETELRPTILFYIPFFLAGLLSVNLYLGSRYKGPQTKSFFWDLCSLAGWPLVWSLGQQSGHLLLPLLFVLLIYSSFRGRLSSRLFSVPWLTNIGGMCYTIYLYHFPLISIFGRFTKKLHFGPNYAAYFALQALLILPLVLLTCIVLFLLVERPCMDRRWPAKFVSFLSKLGPGSRRTSQQDSELDRAVLSKSE